MMSSFFCYLIFKASSVKDHLDAINGRGSSLTPHSSPQKSSKIATLISRANVAVSVAPMCTQSQEAGVILL